MRECQLRPSLGAGGGLRVEVEGGWSVVRVEERERLESETLDKCLTVRTSERAHSWREERAE